MKKISKILLLATVMTFGVSTSANAQVLDWLNKAAETVNKATDTYNNARNTYNKATETFSSSSSQNDTPSYRTVGSVSMRAWSRYGHATSRAEVVVDDSGEKLIKSGSSTYIINENYSYDPYESDSDSPSHYKYYISKSGMDYYFNM